MKCFKITNILSFRDGLNFLSKAGWPSCTFISYEAVNWIMERVEGISHEQQAITFLQVNSCSISFHSEFVFYLEINFIFL